MHPWDPLPLLRFLLGEIFCLGKDGLLVGEQSFETVTQDFPELLPRELGKVLKAVNTRLVQSFCEDRTDPLDRLELSLPALSVSVCLCLAESSDLFCPLSETSLRFVFSLARRHGDAGNTSRSPFCQLANQQAKDEIRDIHESL
jgi:hypothetical protein